MNLKNVFRTFNFAAISETNLKIKNILEIEPDGKTATILARLFLIRYKTIDLSDNDPIFINTYARKKIQKNS